MARMFRLCILRIRHDPSYQFIPDSSCRQFLFDAPDRSSPVQYWSDMTYRDIDLRIDMLPWYDVLFDVAPMRGQAAQAAKQAAADHDLTAYDGFAVIVHPGFVDIPNPTAGQPATRAYFDAGTVGDSAVLPVATANHTFICHELGHVLGYGHTFGLPTVNPWDPTGAQWFEYGDPYDIMSSAGFGGTSATFSRSDLETAVAGWPRGYWPAADMWYSMGPGLARAQLRHRDPNALLGHSVVVDDTGSGWSGSFTLVSAGILFQSGTQLLILRPQGASLSTLDDPPGTFYLEYRGQHGWDRGLGTPAVVLHQKADDGNGRQVIWYRGRLPIPLQTASSLSSSAGDLAVQLDSVSSDLSTVTVTLRRSIERGVFLFFDSKVISRTEIERQQVTLGTCGTRTYAMSRYAVTVEGTFRVSHSGFATSPRFRWLVGGKTLADATFGYEDVQAIDGRTVMIFWNTDLDGGQLHFTNNPAEGTFDLEVQVFVSEADGSNTLSSGLVPYHAAGLEDRYEEAYYEDRWECFRRIMSKLGFNPPNVIPPPGPGPDPGAIRRVASPSPFNARMTLATLIGDIEAINLRVAAEELREFQNALATEHSLLARLNSASGTAT
jgi:hypothetical protein